MNCEQVIKRDVAERYLGGELDQPDQEAFEQHYFECARCFDELETYRALREVLRESTQVPAAAPTASSTRFDWRWGAAAAGVVLAIALGSWLPRTSSAPPDVAGTSPAPVAGALPAVEQPGPRLPVPSLADLAHVLPPGYTPAILRGVQGDAARRFREAMQRYVKGDYAGARAGLVVAARGDPDAPDIAFYLGICFLLTDETAGAVEQLRSTIALGDSPFLEDARFYLAKAHLRRGELQAAASELAKTVELRGDRETEARDLLRQVDILRKAG